jgi:hypothetical protein
LPPAAQPEASAVVAATGAGQLSSELVDLSQQPATQSPVHVSQSQQGAIPSPGPASQSQQPAILSPGPASQSPQPTTHLQPAIRWSTTIAAAAAASAVSGAAPHGGSGAEDLEPTVAANARKLLGVDTSNALKTIQACTRPMHTVCTEHRLVLGISIP